MPSGFSATVSPDMRLLVIERDRQIASAIFEYFECRGHQLDAAGDGVTGLHLAVSNAYYAVVLDWMLPCIEGPDLISKLRSEHDVSVPVLMLTERRELSDKIRAFRSGADDYVTKPFEIPELEIRLEALVSRAQGRSATRRLIVGGLTLDLATLIVTREGRQLQLYPGSRKLLQVLMRASPSAVSRQELEHALWGDDPPDRDLLRSHMSSLRRSVDGGFDGKLIHTLPRFGYRLGAEMIVSGTPRKGFTSDVVDLCGK
ncbi:DNA-binding response OmpR family regulator [Xanthomonas arboricola]|nr:DNA-binding response OmpR family regulator [Xanthomonas euroxanthea]